jgi:hypothetical protein
MGRHLITPHTRVVVAEKPLAGFKTTARVVAETSNFFFSHLEIS